MMTIIVILVVSGALILGAVWGIYWKLPKKTEGFLVALAGGALMVSAILELIEPATKKSQYFKELKGAARTANPNALIRLPPCCI